MTSCTLTVSSARFMRSASLAFLIVSVLAAAPALAGGGRVLPASAEPKDYSLVDIARATAVFNTGQQAGNPNTPPPPNVPFHVLVADSTVDAGTMIYLPVFVGDDSGDPSIFPGFPTDIRDQDDDADYLDDLVLSQFGVTSFLIQVDGHTTVLDDDYITGTTTAPLLDGTPAGTHYIVSAAFLSPLSPGKHTVAIGGVIGGKDVVFLSYSVTVDERRED
jgi:hypothetical protein